MAPLQTQQSNFTMLLIVCVLCCVCCVCVCVCTCVCMCVCVHVRMHVCTHASFNTAQKFLQVWLFHTPDNPPTLARRDL